MHDESLDRQSGSASRIRFALVIALVALLSWAGWRQVLPEPRLLRVTFLDVGQGDAIVVESPGGRTLVVDCGPSGEGFERDETGPPPKSQGMRTLVPYLRSRGIQRIDALLLTHADRDHTGGAPDLLDRMPTKRLLLGPSEADHPDMREAVATARRAGARVETISRGQTLDCRDGVTAAVIHPPAHPASHPESHPASHSESYPASRPASRPAPRGRPLSDNDRSVALRIRYGNCSVLLTGDAEEHAELAMAAAGGIRSDVLKLAHHGSKTSSTPAYLEAVMPRAAIVSCGRRNRFGHPHPSVLARLERASIPLFRTDKDGAVTLETDGARIWIRRTVRR